ncbi:helix-turn-helix domain-containing protein [Chloroflexales bacterium ZM16-3]|nr:helix-turn-helix domain-containing protein [Chloroflexales bacterium ZM16-3]
MTKLLLSVRGAFAKYARTLITERQREGLAMAKQRGAYCDHKLALNDVQVTDLRRRVSAGKQKAALARTFGISRETLYQYLKREGELPRRALPARWLRGVIAIPCLVVTCHHRRRH